jgi:hypothetical protein
MIRQTPSKDPRFQKWVIFEGAGRSIRAELAIFNKGWCFRGFIGISFKGAF